MEPWQAALIRGDTESAWGHFIERYRPLILATIRRTLPNDEDVFEAFADVCDALSADGLARLSRYGDRVGRQARFSTWLVVVVRNRVIDWLRKASSPRRPAPPQGLSSVQREIFRFVFAEQRSHAEAFELLRSGSEPGLTFGAFLRELAVTYRLATGPSGQSVLRHFPGPPSLDCAAGPHPDELLLTAETEARLSTVLEKLPTDTRLALQLFVVEELPADQVAQVVGWPNAKAVYNRVYRTLSALRRALARQGIRQGDL